MNYCAISGVGHVVQASEKDVKFESCARKECRGCRIGAHEWYNERISRDKQYSNVDLGWVRVPMLEEWHENQLNWVGDCSHVCEGEELSKRAPSIDF